MQIARATTFNRKSGEMWEFTALHWSLLTKSQTATFSAARQLRVIGFMQGQLRTGPIVRELSFICH